MLTPEYYIKRLGELRFTVAKFDGTREPVEVYYVSFSSKTDTGRCSCPAFRVHGTGSSDKHIKMVKEWIYNGELPPNGFFSDNHSFRLARAGKGTARSVRSVRSDRNVPPRRGRYGSYRDANAEAQMVGRDVRQRRAA